MGHADGRGFTVIELGLGVAALTTGLAVFGPAASSIRGNGLDARSGFVHHELGRRQFMYMGDHNGDFTGPNTSGLEWNKEPLGDPGMFPNKGLETLYGDTGGGNPTSQGDWLTPLVGDSYGFSANRAERMRQKFDVVADPTAGAMVDALYVGDVPEDIDDFERVFNEQGYRQQSFLMMRSFTHFSSEQRSSAIVLDQKNGYFYRELFAVQSPGSVALSPEAYSPNIMNVGMQLSNKVMFADGTRFFNQGVLELDVEVFNPRFSEDTSNGPVFDRSVAYGQGSPYAPDGENLDLSYRKRGGAGMYATMFDGSLRYFSREESWTDPTPWYPSGSVWTGNGATAESSAWVAENLPGGVIP